MAKKRKTRHQKVLADHRHVAYHLESVTAQVSRPSEKKQTFEAEIRKFTPQTHTSYAYVLIDIKKTAFITASILLAQIVLFILTKRI